MGKEVSEDMSRLQGQVAVITGGAKGIGFGIAETLANEGARIVLVDQSAADLATAAEHLKAKGIDAACATVDVTQLAAVQSTVESVLASHGKIDVLVQAAGITGKTATMTEDVDPDNFNLVMAVNVNGIFNFCKAVLPSMKAAKYGRIVNIASISGKEGNAGMLAYSTSKAAVIGLTKVIGTAMVDAMPEQQVTYMTDKIPMKRCGTIQEIANLALFAASPEASFTTAFCFDATGGRATY